MGQAAVGGVPGLRVQESERPQVAAHGLERKWENLSQAEQLITPPSPITVIGDIVKNHK